MVEEEVHPGSANLLCCSEIPSPANFRRRAKVHKAGIARFFLHRTQRHCDLANVVHGPCQQADHGQNEENRRQDRRVFPIQPETEQQARADRSSQRNQSQQEAAANQFCALFDGLDLRCAGVRLLLSAVLGGIVSCMGILTQPSDHTHQSHIDGKNEQAVAETKIAGATKA